MTALAVTLGICSPALAMPGDPPIVPLSPANGGVVGGDPAGVPVTFECPAYVIAVFSGGGVTITQRGDYEDYDVRFSYSPALGADGRLEAGFDGESSARLNPDGTTCTSLLDTDDGGNSPEIVGGTIYWQVSRFCNGCGGNQQELAPVQSLVITPVRVKATLKAPARPYSGYLSLFTLTSKATLGGANVALQRRVGKRWKTLDTKAFSSSGTELLAKLPAGRQRLRAQIVAGTRTFIAAQRTLTVRRGGPRATSTRDDGAYRVRRAQKGHRLKFRVAGRGTKILGLSVSVTMFCFPSANAADNRVQIGFGGLRSVRVAPDGTVVGLYETKGAKTRFLLTGKLRNGRFRGKAALSFSKARCAGTRTLDLVRR